MAIYSIPANQCPILRDIVNGYYNLPQCTDTKLHRTAGAKCELVCGTGFKLSEENAQWVCQNSGDWTNKDKQVMCKGRSKHCVKVGRSQFLTMDMDFNAYWS